MIGYLARTNEKLESKIAVASTVTDRLVEQVHELRQYSRRPNLLIHGVEEEETRDRKHKEDTDGKVMKIVQDQLGLRDKVMLNDISRSHRLGKRRNDGKKRPIIVRFTSYRSRKMVFDQKKHLKRSGVSITENLTPERYETYKKCWEKFGKENCWTLDRRINCLLQEQDINRRRKLIVVTKDADLAD